MKLLISLAAIASLALQANAATAPLWSQCGGIGWTGPTECEAPGICNYINPHCKFAMSSLHLLDSRYEFSGLYNLSLYYHLDNLYHSQAYNDCHSFDQLYHTDFDYYGHCNYDKDHNYNHHYDANDINHHHD
ncbi:hypothetical protein FRC01_003746 [Tulasnella sp. 417]|nr:hypothetical protein FRC01_003746 [Tulasnella sp. 417]